MEPSRTGRRMFQTACMYPREARIARSPSIRVPAIAGRSNGTKTYREHWKARTHPAVESAMPGPRADFPDQAGKNRGNPAQDREIVSGNSLDRFARVLQFDDLEPIEP